MKYYPPVDATDPNAPYIDGNPSAGIEGSPVPAGPIEFTQREIVHVITQAGLTPSADDNEQLDKAIDIKIAEAIAVGGFYHLVAMSATAPTGTFNDGDIYYNTASKQVFTWATGAWGNPASPEYGHFYEYSGNFYIWNGTDLASALNPYYMTQFLDFYETSPPSGWLVRNGALIANASTSVPKLYEALQLSENAWKLKTETEWQEMSALEPWLGIGGVPYFVLDTAANTIRLPDTRGMYAEMSGFDGLDVGGVHGDQMQGHGHGLYQQQIFASGSQNNAVRGGSSVAASGSGEAVIDTGHGTPRIGDITKPRAYGVLGCVYVGV